MNSLKHHGFYYGSLLYAVLIPFPPKTINIALIVWVLLSIFGCRRSTLLKNNFLWILPVFYTTYFIGVFTSETPSFKFLEYKLSLLVFPLLFFLRVYDEKQRSGILKVFVLGLAASVTTCLVMACYNSISIHDGGFLFQPNVLEGKGFMESILYGGNFFFGRHLSIFHQTVYFALYLTSGVAVLLFRPKLFPSRHRIALLGVLTIFIFLVSNKASFIALAFIFGIKIWTWKVKRNKKLIGVSLFVLALLLFTFFNPRIRESIETITAGKLILEKEARYGFATRLLSWDAALSLIKEKPILGYGYADAQKELNKKYEEKGYIFPLKESYNAHNLWLQSWLENGLLAIVILIGIFLGLARHFFNNGKLSPLILSFIVILLLNSLFEGLFNRFSGISFFAFLVSFIFSESKGGLPKS